MATKEELRSMVKQFRVAELRSLLDFVGERNSRLRKKELQKKALKLISSTRKRSTVIAHKVRTMYKCMRGDNVDSPLLSDLEDSIDLDFFAEQRLTEFGFLESYDTQTADNCYGSSRTDCHQSFSMFTKNLDMQRIGSVRFTKLTFYKYESDILFITPMIPKKQDDDVFLFDLTFPLNYEAANLLFSEGSRHQVLLRFCVLNNELEVTDHLPPMLSASINHNYCSLPAVGPATNKKGSVSQCGAPVNITQYLEKNKYINSLSLQWSVDYFTLYGVAIQLVHKYTADELIAKLKEKGERDPAVSKKFIYDNLNDQDNEIAATSLKMSLICPLGKMLMSLPTRASTCNHLQCFDGYLYVKLNEVKSSWQCPVCNQTCLYENLFVDGYFMEILRSDKFMPNITDVQLNADGSWESVMHQDKAKPRPRSSPVKIRDVPEKRPKLDPPPPQHDVCFGQSILDDLQSFFKNLSDISSYRSCFPALPPCDDVPASDSFFNVKPMNDAELSALSTTGSRSEPASKKNVLIVDLTESDSESDEIHSVSSFSDEAESPSSPSCVSYDTPRTSSPPVYDIDSDSSF